VYKILLSIILFPGDHNRCSAVHTAVSIHGLLHEAMIMRLNGGGIFLGIFSPNYNIYTYREDCRN